MKKSAWEDEKIARKRKVEMRRELVNEEEDEKAIGAVTVITVM